MHFTHVLNCVIMYCTDSVEGYNLRIRIRGVSEMKEAVILQSPHAIDPMKNLTEAEKVERYRTRLDETFRPYTVVDVLTGVYHRCFEDDLRNYIGENPDEFVSLEEGWCVSRAWVNECRVGRVETLFFQPLSDFQVELFVHTALRVEIVRNGNALLKRTKSIRTDLRLQYSLDLCPCKLTCRFTKAIVKEEDSLIARYPNAIRADKYLLPVLQEADYAYLSKWFMAQHGISAQEVPLDAEAIVKRLSLKLLKGVFPENGVMGEIYFNYGHAMIIDPDTGEVRDADIDPGTIILNIAACSSLGLYNVTLLHECAHHLLAIKHFLLQMTHGHQFCSYLCKKKGAAQRQPGEQLSPVDIMEIQANKLPGYMLIGAEHGKAKAEELLNSYQNRSIAGMTRLVRDMAEYYGTTQTVSRTRLQTMGYQEVRGIFQSANGELVPAYVSDLKDGQTYTISHSDALKEYVVNPAFRTALDSGRYIYCEGHFCLNDTRYVKFDHMGYPHLSAYAREHMAECCLVFETAYSSPLKRLINGVLQKGRGGKKQVTYVSRDGGSPVTAEGQAFRKMIAREFNVASLIHTTFNDMVVRLMDARGISIGQLAEATGLSDETIKNMRNDPERQFSIGSIVAVCIGLHLLPEVSMQLIDSSPAKFMHSEEMSAYRYVLNHCYDQDVRKVNRILVEAGFRPLTDAVDGFGENGVRLDA